MYIASHSDQPGVPLPEILMRAVSGLVKRRDRDLTARQLSMFLICYLTDEPQTVRGLAAQLGLSRPAISKALSRLQTLSLATRASDHRDGRSVLVRRTPQGQEFLRDIDQLLLEAAKRMPGAVPAGRRGRAVPAALGLRERLD